MREYVVALAEALDERLERHLLREDGQEDLCFALYRLAEGSERTTVVLFDAVLPNDGDRDVHGNVAFHSGYIRRALRLAAEHQSGLALLHSHPLGTGWQDMSDDDIRAELGHAAVTFAETRLPLAGLTIARDGAWSARVWLPAVNYQYDRVDCASVRVAGHRLCFTEHPRFVGRSNGKQIRTLSFWGEQAQQRFTDLHVAIVGLGSVGSIVAEGLARMGVRRLTLIDNDRIEIHNLDRILGASEQDLGRPKVEVAARQIALAATAERICIRRNQTSLTSDEGFRALLDCDVAFSCVDRPLPRHHLNIAAYAYLIPVIDGGILVRHDPRSREFLGANWSVQTAAPGRACLLCRGAYDLSSVSLEQTGLLDDSSYVAGLPETSELKRRENIFPLSASVASFEIMQLVAMVSGLMNLPDLEQQRYSYYPGVVRIESASACQPGCPFPKLVASATRTPSLS